MPNKNNNVMTFDKNGNRYHVDSLVLNHKGNTIAFSQKKVGGYSVFVTDNEGGYNYHMSGKNKHEAEQVLGALDAIRLVTLIDTEYNKRWTVFPDAVIDFK